MAPLLGSSWSSFWAPQTAYAPVQNTEMGTSTNSPTSTTPDPLRPTIGQILMSKRIRYIASAVFVGFLFFLAFHHYDRIPTLDSWRQATAITTADGITSAVPTNAYCPNPESSESTENGNVDWSQFAYTQYVTNEAYLCNSVMIFETLWRLKSKADRVMMYPEEMMDPAEKSPNTNEAKLLVKARDRYNVKLVPISVQRRDGGDGKHPHPHSPMLLNVHGSRFTVYGSLFTH